jgi:thiol-disulfide isomerase/thioredoxin
MKHLYMLFAVLTISSTALAQLPSGSIAPDFTATDIDGVEHNLYNLLDEGYQVILDFSATWCGPCWGYHEDGILEDLYEMYGPDGTNEIRVFYLESDDNTTDADLNGTGANTQGDWVTGTTYPIIDNAANIFNSYSNTYYPTIYTVCPNRNLTESGPATIAGHAEVFQADACAAASLPNDAALVGYTGETVACGDITLSVNLMNEGLDYLTSCTITAYDGANAVGSTDWSGSLETYAIEDVVVTTTTLDGSTDFDFTITSSDDNADNNSAASGMVNASAQTTTNVRVSITTDNWPEETGWSIESADGMYIDGVDAGDLAVWPNSDFIWDVALNLDECYFFTITDTYGDGLYATQWPAGTADGMASVVSMDGETEMGIILEYNGDSDFFELKAGIETTSETIPPAPVVGISENDLTSSVNVFPNPFTDNTTLSFSAAEAGQASVVVYNLVGKKVIEMNLGNIAAGTQNIELDFASMEAGIYLVSLTAGNETSTLRVTNAQ